MHIQGLFAGGKLWNSGNSRFKVLSIGVEIASILDLSHRSRTDYQLLLRMILPFAVSDGLHPLYILIAPHRYLRQLVERDSERFSSKRSPRHRCRSPSLFSYHLSSSRRLFGLILL